MDTGLFLQAAWGAHALTPSLLPRKSSDAYDSAAAPAPPPAAFYAVFRHSGISRVSPKTELQACEHCVPVHSGSKFSTLVFRKRRPLP